MEEKPKTNLDELVGKSWNLEMIISGAAIFFTTQLPGLIESALHFYLHEIQPNDDPRFAMFPLLAYAFMMSVSWLLTFAFIVHFVLRAFWVSLVGLHAVWPGGIQYDKIPNLEGNAPEFLEQKLGQIEPLIRRIDRMANQIFSFAFLVALMGIGISMVYLFGLFLTVLAKWFLLQDSIDFIWKSFSYFFMGFGVFTVGLNILLKKNRRLSKKYGHLTGRVSWYMGRLMMPAVHRPLNYLTYTFASNIPRKRYYFGMVSTMVLVMTLVFLNLFLKVGSLRDRHIFVSRELFGDGSARLELVEKKYDNLRPAGHFLPAISLPAEVWEENYLPVFVSYPHWLDSRVAQNCTVPELPGDFPKSEKRNHLDSLRLGCHRSFFQVSVNDNLIAKPEFVFQVKSGTKGLLTFLDGQCFQKGKKNWVTVKIPSADRPDSLEIYGEAVFWYFPK